jgi:hypothetical protein
MFMSLTSPSNSNATHVSVRLLFLSYFLVDLRERARVCLGTASRLPSISMSNLHTTLDFVQQTVAEDFGEPLYPLPVSSEDSTEGGRSSTNENDEVRR